MRIGATGGQVGLQQLRGLQFPLAQSAHQFDQRDFCAADYQAGERLQAGEVLVCP
jgi:hypothetical protein